MPKRITKLLIFCAGCLVAFGNASASNTMMGTIQELWVNEDSISSEIYISIGRLYAGPCSVRETRYLVIDKAEPGMEEAFDLALTAFLNETPIKMKGTGECYRTSQYETLDYIHLNQ